MNDTDKLFEDARRFLERQGRCSFDVKGDEHLDWMRSACLRLTGGRLKMLPARTIAAEVRILPVGENRLIVWDYEHLAQLEYLQFILQVDNDDDLSTLAHFTLYHFAARVLLARGYLIHSGQLLRGTNRAFPNIAEIEANHRGRKAYDSEAANLTRYLLFFHEMGHYIFRQPSAQQERYFHLASDRIEELRKKAQQSLVDGDFSSIQGPRLGSSLPGDDMDGAYNENLIAYLDKHQTSPAFLEEVSCDLFAVEQVLKLDRTRKAPGDFARWYSILMMHYQIQATLAALRRRYEKIESPEDTIDVEPNTGNQIRNDIRGFYFHDKISEIVDTDLPFWIVWGTEVNRVYNEGVRKRYWSIVLEAAAAVLEKADDKTWLAECDERTRSLDFQEREKIRDALESDYGFRA